MNTDIKLVALDLDRQLFVRKPSVRSKQTGIN